MDNGKSLRVFGSPRFPAFCKALQDRRPDLPIQLSYNSLRREEGPSQSPKVPDWARPARDPNRLSLGLPGQVDSISPICRT
jgi:hypothetical protein